MNINVGRLQIIIVLACLFTLIIRFSSLHTAEAQSGCEASTPLKTNPPNPQFHAWPPNTTVSVKIYEKSNGQTTSDAEFDAISASIRGWNGISVTGCSGININQPTRTNTVWPGDTEAPATNEILIVRTTDRPGQWQEVANATGMYGGWLYLNSDYNHTRIPKGQGPLYRVDNLVRHESGHSFGLTDGSTSAPPSVMATNSFDSSNTLQITACDIDGHRRVYCPPTPTPTPTPTPEPCYYEQPEQPSDPSGYGELMCEVCQDGYDNDCASGTDYEDYKCLQCTSPIVIDMLGDGFDLTSAQEGVDFDIAGVGRPIRVSWTQGDDAWLALDRNRNNMIDSGKELFGAVTFQAASTQRNGFLALAEYDRPTNGGDGDGVIDSRDAIFSSLRLWQDANHNGISEQSELRTLPSMGVAQLDLDYHESRRVDARGNRFRYRAKVRDAQGADLGRWAWDVFLAHASPNNRTGLAPEVSILFAPKLAVFRFAKPRCGG